MVDMFAEYEAASLKRKFEMLGDREFCLLRYHALTQAFDGDRVQALRNFVSYANNETEYLQCPASSRKRYHLAEFGGLLRHSVLVSEIYVELIKLHGVEMDQTSARLVSLYHDMSKSGIAGVAVGDTFQPRYLPTTEEEKYRTGEDYKFNRDMTTLNLPVASLWIVSSFVPLTAKEAQCIVAHDGLHLYQNKEYAHKLYPEALLLQMADEMSLLYERELV